MKLNTYQKTAITTVIATLFLILVGGLVRATGAGLGCPDWPKCFGVWIPPTNVADLPEGFTPDQFNVWKTWTEYVNRLIGVVIGLLIIATFVLSFRYRKTKPSIFWASFAALILVLFQGWLGGEVVKSGLYEGLITLHMVLAMVIVSTLLYAAFKASSEFVTVNISEVTKKQLFSIGVVLFGLTVIQLILGTQVREAVDVIKEAAYVPPRDTWIEQIGSVFSIHRSFSWLLLGVALYLWYYLWKNKLDGFINQLGYINVALVIGQVLVGIILQVFHLPKPFQVIHLVGIALMICGQFLMLLTIKMRTDKVL